MKFTTINGKSKDVIVEHDKYKVVFNVREIVKYTPPYTGPKVNGDPLWVLVEDYLNYKGSDVQTTLMNKYIEFIDKVQEAVLYNNYNILHEIIRDIAKMFHIDDLYKFAKEHSLIIAPDKLIDEYVDIKGTSNTRAQTYTKEDYYYLAGLTILSKILVLPLAHYATRLSSTLHSIIPEYTLYQILLPVEELVESRPMKKIYDMCVNMYESNSKKSNSIHMSKLIFEAAIPEWLTAHVFIKKLPLNYIIGDQYHKSVINNIYYSINNAIDSNTSTSNTYIDKNDVTTLSEDGEPESFLESYRNPSDISAAGTVEFSWALSNPYQLLEQLDVPYDKKRVDKLIAYIYKYQDNFDIPDNTLTILSWIFYRHIDPRAKYKLDIDAVINAIVVGYLYCKHNGFEDIGYLLTINKNEFGSIEITGIQTKDKLKKEIVDELSKIFNTKYITRTNTGDKVVTTYENRIKKIAAEYDKEPYEYMLPITELDGRPKVVEIPRSIRNIIAQFILHCYNNIWSKKEN